MQTCLTGTRSKEPVSAPPARAPVHLTGKNFYASLIGERHFSRLFEAIDSDRFGSGGMQILKDCRSTTLAFINGREFGLEYDLCLKRINYKGLPHFLSKKIFGNRASRLWKINNSLLKKGIPVPHPIGFLEPVSFRRKVFYYISEFIGNAFQLAECIVTDGEKTALLVGKSIADFHNAGYIHGDLKWENIILKRDGANYRPFLLDMDQATLCGNGPDIRGIKRDLFQFYRFGLLFGGKEWMDAHFIPSYKSFIGPEIDYLDVKKLAERDLLKRPY